MGGQQKKSEPTIFLLIGFAGTGKLTVAKALSKQLARQKQTVRLVDNHYVNNPIFNLIDHDGMQPLPWGTWNLVAEVREAVVATIARLSPSEWSFIFTNDLVESAGEREWVSRLEQLARGKGALFVPVRLLCQKQELYRRVVSKERQRAHKLVSLKLLKEHMRNQKVLDVHHKNTLSMDITKLPPEEAAEHILAHAAKLRLS